MKKILFICFNNILRYPPTMAVIQTLNDLGYELIVITLGNSELDLRKHFGELRNTSFELIGNLLMSDDNIFKKLLLIPVLKRKVWNCIDKYYDEDSILWVVDEITLRHLGNRLLRYRYILHLMEIREKLVYSERFPFITMDSHTFGSKALAVVVCEYNRAHITRALWNLKELPLVLPNKPQYKIEIPSKSRITSSLKGKEIIDKLKGKKIILYQGLVTKERPLDGYISAVNKMGEDYAFVLVSGTDNPCSGIKYSNFYHIPFVEPPYHLEITSNAFIGVLSYTHTHLNTLYCAPNKIWEYAKFSIPMISNDLPSLHYEFCLNRMGLCVDENDETSIINGIKKIESDYVSYSLGAKHFYDSIDFAERIEEILDYTEKNRIRSHV